jgi:hypothetical protein
MTDVARTWEVISRRPRHTPTDLDVACSMISALGSFCHPKRLDQLDLPAEVHGIPKSRARHPI